MEKFLFGSVIVLIFSYILYFEPIVAMYLDSANWELFTTPECGFCNKQKQEIPSFKKIKQAVPPCESVPCWRNSKTGEVHYGYKTKYELLKMAWGK